MRGRVRERSQREGRREGEQIDTARGREKEATSKEK